jgi:hypothetical protein
VEVVKRFLLLVAVLAVLVAACGGTTTDTTAVDDPAAAQTKTGDTDAEEDDSDGAAAPADTGEIDLGEDGELGLDDFIPGAQAFDPDADFRSQEMEIQQQIAECMAQEGFEYIPYVPSDIGGGFGPGEFEQEEYVKTYGFGVATWVLEADNFGYYDEESDPNPNRAIEEAMDEFEREEYYRALWGGEPPLIENTPPEEIDAMTDAERDEFYNSAYENWMPDGCESSAYEEAYGGGEEDMAFWEEFGQDYEEVFMRAESDSRIVEAQAGWSSCMAEKGHDFANQEAMYTYFWGGDVGGEYVESEFSKAVNELIKWPESEFPEIEVGENGEEVIVEDPVIEDPSLYLPEYDIEELQPYIDEEIAVATADYECSKDRFEIWEDVYKELEQQFIEDNLDRLLAFKETHG